MGNQEDLITETFALVEATSFEQHMIWKKYFQGAGKHHVQLHGWLAKANETNISLSFVEIHGEVICFWEPTSMIINHYDIQKYFDAFFVNTNIKIDAANFHIVLNKLV